MKKKRIILYALGGLLLAGCTRETMSVPSVSEGEIIARVSVDDLEGNGIEQDARILTIQGYRFEGEVLKEIITSFRAGEDGSYIFQPQRAEGEICLLANAGKVRNLQEVLPDVTTKSEFLKLSADKDELASEEGGLAMSGWMNPNGISSGKSEVSLRRSVSRIDLSSFDKGVKVHRVTVSHIYRQGYLNGQESVETPDGASTYDFRKEYVAFENGSECLFYLPEQTNNKLQVEILASFDGAQHRLETSLPAAIRRNVVYTLSVYGRGGNLSVSVTEDNWQAGGETESGLQLNGLVDVDASRLSEGVRVNLSRDTVFIPYTRSDSHLVLLGESGADVEIEGQVDGVVVQRVAGRGLQPIADISVSTSMRMPGTEEEYIYLEVYRQNVYAGRVVLVVEPSPIRLEGQIKLNEQGICDFDRYVEGELGRLTLPAGKIAGMEFDSGTSRWIKLAPDGETYRIVGGWKPNDPQADGRVQEGRLVISDADGKNREVYVIRRRNWGLPVVNINGTWWCKYNLRGNVKTFSDQILAGTDPAKEIDLATYLSTCDENELLHLLGYQYQAGYPDGYPLKHNETAFYYEGMRNSAENFGLLSSEEMAPEGYQIPDYDDYAFFTRNTDFNLGGQGTHTYRNAAGQELTVTITEREVSFEGHLYGVIAFYEFQYEGARWVLCGLGHQWNTTPGSIARMSLLLATHGHSSNTWVMEGYAHTEKPGENWLKYVPQNNTKTRTIRCIKKPVEYIYE